MYELDARFLDNLRDRASCFLEDNLEKQNEMRKKLKAFYRARSSVVHNWKTNITNDYYRRISEQSDYGFDLARRTLFKLLQGGPPSDWNKFVLSGGD